MQDARVIANAILDRAVEYGRPMTNLDLQKILYFMHGHFLRRHGRPLTNTEFEAWPYGPVNKVAYDAFKGFNDTPIDTRAVSFDPVRRVQRDLPELTDGDVLGLLDDFLEYYFDMHTYLLVEFTHQPGTPWFETIEQSKRRPNIGMRIANELILARFEGAAPHVNDLPKRRNEDIAFMQKAG